MRSRTDNIHHYGRRLERAIRYLKSRSKITEENKTQILSFLERITAEGLSLARQVSYVQWLTTIAVALPPEKNFADTTQEDVQRLVGGFNNRNWSDSTKQNHIQAIKRYWRWMRKCPEGKDPPETDWFKAGKGKGRKILPEELLEREEAQRIVCVGRLVRTHEKSSCLLLQFDSVKRALFGQISQQLFEFLFQLGPLARLFLSQLLQHFAFRSTRSLFRLARLY